MPPRLRPILALTLVVLGAGAWGLLRAQRPFQEYPGIEYNDFPIPSDWNQKTEWTRARLRYPSVYASGNGLYSSGRGGFGRGFGRGGFGFGRADLTWTTDYPRSDRHLLEGIRRLTRIETRSVEQVVDLDGTGDEFDFPMMYAVEVGHWDLPDDQAAQLREFLLRGGFLMVDDFHGDEPYHNVYSEWQVFLTSMKRVFPDRPIVDLENNNPIFHTVYDLDDRFQVPGWQWVRSGLTYEAGRTGMTPHWRAIFDDKGRVMVAICHNMDLGDAWEWSDDPRYPEKWARLAYQIAVNYFIYDLTH